VHEAAAQGRAHDLLRLIQGGAAVNIVAVDSITPLHEACVQGQTQCVRLLLVAGAQVRDPTSIPVKISKLYRIANPIVHWYTGHI